MFWNKPPQPQETPLIDEIRSIKARISRIETELLDLMQGQALIRDKIMRKMRLKYATEEEESDTWAGIPKAKI